MSVLEAPVLTRDRAHAREFLNQLPDDLNGVAIEIQFAKRAIATTSFVDEIVHELFVNRNVGHISLVNLNGSACSVAKAASAEFGAADRLTCR